ncbi:hypothetical protein NXS19_009663 [Fusarium pseudograminearum]|nr:hypothetical protein NXS19_009663 [Fusarium pseudograminearum]
MVSIAEGKKITKTPGGAGATAETADWGADWGDAWDEDNEQPKDESKPTTKEPDSTKADEDDGADAWGWDEEDTTAEAQNTKQTTEKNDEDDSAAAWGWGDEDTAQAPEQVPATRSKIPQAQEETRELVLKEIYSVSSMPEPVLDLIYAILEDGAALTRTMLSMRQLQPQPLDSSVYPRSPWHCSGPSRHTTTLLAKGVTCSYTTTPCI